MWRYRHIFALQEIAFYISTLAEVLLFVSLSSFKSPLIFAFDRPLYQIIFGSPLDMTFVRFGTAAALGLALAAYSSRTDSIRPVERIY
jgi:hypothetical protein